MAGRESDLVECVCPVCHIRRAAPVAFAKQNRERKQKLDDFEQTS